MPLGGNGEGGGSRLRLMDVNTRRLTVQVDMPFQIGRGGIRKLVYDQTRLPEKGASRIGTSKSEFMIVQVDWCYAYILKASDLFLQCKKHYISYNGVGTSGWRIYSQQAW